MQTRSYYAIVFISLNILFFLHTSNLYTSFFFYFIQLYFIFVSSFGYKLFREHESSSVNSFINLNKKGTHDSLNEHIKISWEKRRPAFLKHEWR